MLSKILELENVKILGKKDQSQLQGGHNTGGSITACRRNCQNKYNECTSKCSTNDLQCINFCAGDFACCLDTCIPFGGQPN